MSENNLSNSTDGQTLNKIAEIQSKLISQNFDLDSFMELIVNETQSLTKAVGVVLELAEGDNMASPK